MASAANAEVQVFCRDHPGGTGNPDGLPGKYAVPLFYKGLAKMSVSRPAARVLKFNKQAEHVIKTGTSDRSVHYGINGIMPSPKIHAIMKSVKPG